jgi:hypothetical protein
VFRVRAAIRDYNPIITKYAIDHQEAAGTVLKGTAMSVVSVIVNNKILKVPFVFQTKIRIKAAFSWYINSNPTNSRKVHKIMPKRKSGISKSFGAQKMTHPEKR